MLGVARPQWWRVEVAGTPRVSAERGRRKKKGVWYILRHEIYKNYVSSVEVGMGMEGQIMCIEQCTFQMSSVAF